MDLVCGSLAGNGFLDYVTGWYFKAAEYIQGRGISVGFVSTSSISQGEQVGILWNELFNRYHLKIHFAHRTFPWESEARGKAHVHVVIVGFGAFDVPVKRLYEHESGGQVSPRPPGAGDASAPQTETTATVRNVRNISPYLVEGGDFAIPIRGRPIASVPGIVNGNKPADGGFLIIEDEDLESFLYDNPTVGPYVRPLVCAEQFLHGQKRWVLWLAGATPEITRENPGVRERLEAVRAFRQASSKASTRRRADVPSLFDQIRQPEREYILIPRHSSENRSYIPFGYFPPDVIIHDSCTAIPEATRYHFGVLTSAMHMAWVRQVCGRLESRLRYSNKLVYNNYPWPEAPSEKQRVAVEARAQAVLDARARYPASSLADLYDPLSMPPDLVKAHAELDRAVDLCYRSQPFGSDAQRVEFLFALYEKLTAPLAAGMAARPTRRRERRGVAPGSGLASAEPTGG